MERERKKTACFPLLIPCLSSSERADVVCCMCNFHRIFRCSHKSFAFVSMLLLDDGQTRWRWGAVFRSLSFRCEWCWWLYVHSVAMITIQMTTIGCYTIYFSRLHFVDSVRVYTRELYISVEDRDLIIFRTHLQWCLTTMYACRFSRGTAFFTI